MEAATNVLAVGLFEGGDLGLFLCEGANEPGSGEVLLGLGGDVGKHGLNTFKTPVDPIPEVLDDYGSRRKRDEGEEGQLRTDAIHEGQRGAGEDQCVGAVHDCGAQKLTNGAQIVGGAGHDVAGSMGVIVTGRLTFKIGEDVVPQVELNLAGDPDNDLSGDVKEDRRAGGDEKEP